MPIFWQGSANSTARDVPNDGAIRTEQKAKTNDERKAKKSVKPTADRDRKIQAAADKFWREDENYLKADVAKAIAKTEKFFDKRTSGKEPLTAERITTIIRSPNFIRKQRVRRAK